MFEYGGGGGGCIYGGGLCGGCVRVYGKGLYVWGDCVPSVMGGGGGLCMHGGGGVSVGVLRVWEGGCVYNQR